MSYEAPGRESALSVRSLRKTFGGGRFPVLDEVSLEIREREIVYVLGPSGAGKSVLLKHLVGLLAPDEGEVRIFGKPIPYHDPIALNEMRKQFGVLFQGAALFDSLTVLQNVAFPLVEQERRISLEEALPKVARTLESVGLDPARDLQKYPRELSGGMVKRVGLARAIVLEPRILLFDEPTTGLDPIVRDMVDGLIFDTSRKLGITSVVISHDLRSALGVADRVAFLQSGRILFEGTPAEFSECAHPAVRSYVRADEHRPRREAHAG